MGMGLAPTSLRQVSTLAASHDHYFNHWETGSSAHLTGSTILVGTGRVSTCERPAVSDPVLSGFCTRFTCIVAFGERSTPP